MASGDEASVVGIDGSLLQDLSSDFKGILKLTKGFGLYSPVNFDLLLVFIQK